MNPMTEDYYILETKESDQDGITLKIEGEPVTAESREQAVKQFVSERRDLDPDQVKQAEAMEEQHYLALTIDELADSFYSHTEKPAVHAILGM